MGTPDAMVLNQHLVLKEILEGRVVVASHPFEIQFSAEHRCNLRCIQCNATIERDHGLVPLMDRKLPQRALERFRKLLPMVPEWQWLSLTGSGEPLLSPDLPAILALLRDQPCHVVINTNGTLMTRRNAEMLVDNRLTALHFSMDGGTKETFERVRAGAKWERVLEGIRTLNAVKVEKGSSLPKVGFSCNFMRDTVDELPQLIDLAADLGVPHVVAHNTVIFDAALADQALMHHPERTRNAVLEATRRARARGVCFDNHVFDLGDAPIDSVAATPPAPEAADRERAAEPSRDPRSPGTAPDAGDPRRHEATASASAAPDDSTAATTAPIATGGDGDGRATIPQLAGLPDHLPAIVRACQRPWTGLYVENEGSVRVCCHNSPLVGNLDEESIEDIWNGVRLRDLRRSFLAGDPPPGCRDCFIFAKFQPRAEVFVRNAQRTSLSFIECPAPTTVPAARLEIAGWAIDRHGVAMVELLLDGAHLGFAEHGHARPDVAAAHPGYQGNGESGFRFVCPEPIPAGDHRVSVRVHSRAGHVEEGVYQPFCASKS
ncbi:MAG: radical SAM protein [Planctomycetes bacterium]|nr:radical SAM protein [Planctomycetota bacterium]